MTFTRKLIFILFLATLWSCAITINGIGFNPTHKEVDAELKPFIDQWLTLANQHGIFFDKTVTAGFVEIKDSLTIGITHYGVGFREIDIDRSYWNSADHWEKTALVWHELGHAYCGRAHDWFGGKRYKDPEDKKSKTKEGYYEDGCPLSLMHPTIVETDCFMAHYYEYVKEIFENCNPY